MFYKANKSALYAIMGVALTSTGSAALADVLVTRSTGAIAREIPRGSRLGDTQAIQLSSGDSVTVLTSSGTRQFNGPGRYRIDGPMRTATGAITTRGRNGTARTGASRSGDSSGPISEIVRTAWQVDINEAGAFCIAAGQPVSLWRGNATADTEVTVTRVADGETMTVAIAAGQYSHSWPESFGATGGTYMVMTSGSPAHTHMEFVSISVDLDDMVAVGEALLSNECNGQLEAMTSSYQTAETTGS
jgi:hypothetical protein